MCILTYFKAIFCLPFQRRKGKLMNCRGSIGGLTFKCHSSQDSVCSVLVGCFMLWLGLSLVEDVGKKVAVFV
jgi:hypothetical protein